MASRILRTSLRSAASPRAVVPKVSFRAMATQTPTPEQRASELVSAVPSTSFASKTGTILAGAGLAAAAISQEIYIVNAESVITVASLFAFYLIAKMGSAPFNKFINDTADKREKILNDARQSHYDGFQKQIDQISLLSSSVEATKDMFALSKQTAQLEAENFVLKQENAVAAEAKSVLDSWVRHEQQVRESEQAELVKTIQANVLKQIGEQKFKKDLMAQAILDVEKMVNAKQV